MKHLGKIRLAGFAGMIFGLLWLSPDHWNTPLVKEK